MSSYTKPDTDFRYHSSLIPAENSALEQGYHTLWRRQRCHCAHLAVVYLVSAFALAAAAFGLYRLHLLESDLKYSSRLGMGPFPTMAGQGGSSAGRRRVAVLVGRSSLAAGETLGAKEPFSFFLFLPLPFSGVFTFLRTGKSREDRKERGKQGMVEITFEHIILTF